jgi:hypothetical protein
LIINLNQKLWQKNSDISKAKETLGNLSFFDEERTKEFDHKMQCFSEEFLEEINGLQGEVSGLQIEEENFLWKFDG